MAGPQAFKIKPFPRPRILLSERVCEPGFYPKLESESKCHSKSVLIRFSKDAARYW